VVLEHRETQAVDYLSLSSGSDMETLFQYVHDGLPPQLRAQFRLSWHRNPLWMSGKIRDQLRIPTSVVQVDYGRMLGGMPKRPFEAWLNLGDLCS
jgi:hypothetical protein